MKLKKMTTIHIYLVPILCVGTYYGTLYVQSQLNQHVENIRVRYTTAFIQECVPVFNSNAERLW